MDSTRKSVAFGENSTVVFDFDLTQSEKSDVWYSVSDLQTIRQDMKLSFRKEGFSRGMEVCCDDNTTVQNQRTCRKNHVKSILALHDEQKNNGCTDAHILHSLSCMLSKYNIKMAQQRATQDSIEAFDEHKASPEFLTAKTAMEFAKQTSRRCCRRGLSARTTSAPASPIAIRC